MVAAEEKKACLRKPAATAASMSQEVAVQSRSATSVAPTIALRDALMVKHDEFAAVVAGNLAIARSTYADYVAAFKPVTNKV